MVTLDHEKYDVVGIVTQMGLTQNALIMGIGLSDRQSGEFIPVPPSDRNKVFPTRGNVFAYEFLKRNPHWENECVCLSVKPNNNQNIVNGEDFVWDWRDDEYIYADRVKKLKTPLCEDGGINYGILVKEGILPCDEIQYFICGDSLFRVEQGMRLLPFWKLSDVNPSSLYIHNGITYVLNDITQEESGKLDLTSDDQLIEWYKKNILKKEWNTIYESKDFKSVDSIVSAELKNLKIPTNVYKSRLGRILNLSSNISLTFEELEDLSSSPWFADSILETMDRFSELYIEKVKKDHAEEISALESKYEQKLKDIKLQFDIDKESIQLKVDEKKKELKSLDERIKKEESERQGEVLKLREEISTLDDAITQKNAEIERLDSRKESIIADFNIIKDVLSMGSSTSSAPADEKVTICTINKNDERDFPTAGPYKKNIEALLMSHQAGKVSSDEIITKLATHNVVLFPDDKTLLATMQATRRCRYAVSYVGVDWKSFNNLLNSGLSAIVSEALMNPDMIHFLVLRNINMSYIPCYLQPVIDMQSGLSTTFPGTSIEFPENLRILCTRTKDTVIPVTEASLEGIGCITPSEDRHTGTGTIAEGYLPVSVFSDLPVYDEYSEDNASESYIDE